MQHNWICWNKITGWNCGFFSRGRGTHSVQWYYSKLKMPCLIQFLWYRQNFFQVSTPLGVLFPTQNKEACILRTSKMPKNMTPSLWLTDLLTFFMKNNWLLVFSLFTKFGVERVNTFKVIKNNTKFPRNREIFGGWVGPYVLSKRKWRDREGSPGRWPGYAMFTKVIFSPAEVSFLWRRAVPRDVRMQSCVVLRFLITPRPPLRETLAFISNIRERLACMRMSQKTDFR